MCTRRTGQSIRRPDGQYAPVCETAKCIASLIGMRIEDAEAALEEARQARLSFANHTDAELDAAVAAARAEYDSRVAQITQRYDEYLRFLEGGNVAVIPGHGFTAPLHDAVDKLRRETQAVKLPLIMPKTTTDAARDVIVTQTALLDSISAQLQLLDRLNDRRTTANNLIAQDSNEGGLTLSDHIDAVYEMSSPLMTDLFYGLITVREETYDGKIVLDIKPFDDAFMRKRIHNRRERDLSSDLEEATKTLQAVEQRESGVAAYIGKVKFHQFHISSKGFVRLSMATLESYPGYIWSILANAEKTDFEIVSKLKDIMHRRHSDFLRMPSRPVFEWVLANSRASDPWYAHVKELRDFEFSPVEIYTHLSDNPMPSFFISRDMSSAQAAAVVGTMRYMYEVLVDRVFDSRKRGVSSSSSSSPKRAASSSSDK